MSTSASSEDSEEDESSKPHSTELELQLAYSVIKEFKNKLKKLKKQNCMVS